MKNKLFIDIIKENFKETFWAIFFNILFGLSVVIVSYSLTILFDSYSLGQREFYNSIALVGVIFIVAVVLSFVSEYFKAVYIRKTNESMKLRMTDNVVNKSYDLVANRDTGKSMSWFINDAGQIESQAFANLIRFVYTITIVISALVSIFILHWILAVVSVCLLGLTLLLPYLTQKYIMKAQEQYTKANEKYTESIRDNLEGLSVFFLGNAISKFYSNMKTTISTKEKEYFSFEVVQARIGSIMLFVSLLSQIGLIVFALYIVSLGLTTAGSVLSVASLAGNLFNGVQGLLGSISTFKTAEVLLNKFQDNTNEDSKFEFEGTIDKLHLDNVSFKYDENEIFDNFSMEFYKNKKYAVIGESGSGKSTLLKLLIGLNKPQSGRVKINDIDLKDLDLKTYYEKIAYVDQFVYLTNGTIRDNITLGTKISEEKLNEVIKFVQLDSFIGKQSSGLDTYIDSNGQEISGGEKQRIALARALVRDVDFIFVDETTSQLDKETRNIIENAILNLNNIGLIYISHNTDSQMLNRFDVVLDSASFK